MIIGQHPCYLQGHTSQALLVNELISLQSSACLCSKLLWGSGGGQWLSAHFTFSNADLDRMKLNKHVVLWKYSPDRSTFMEMQLLTKAKNKSFQIFKEKKSYMYCFLSKPA